MRLLWISFVGEVACACLVCVGAVVEETEVVVEKGICSIDVGAGPDDLCWCVEVRVWRCIEHGELCIPSLRFISFGWGVGVVHDCNFLRISSSKIFCGKASSKGDSVVINLLTGDSSIHRRRF